VEVLDSSDGRSNESNDEVSDMVEVDDTVEVNDI